MEEWTSHPQTQEQEEWTSGREITLRVRGYEGERRIRVGTTEELIEKIIETTRELGIGNFMVLIDDRRVRPADVRNMNLDEIGVVEIVPFDKGAF